VGINTPGKRGILPRNAGKESWGMEFWPPPLNLHMPTQFKSSTLSLSLNSHFILSSECLVYFQNEGLEGRVNEIFKVRYRSPCPRPSHLHPRFNVYPGEGRSPRHPSPLTVGHSHSQSSRLDELGVLVSSGIENYWQDLLVQLHAIS